MEKVEKTDKILFENEVNANTREKTWENMRFFEKKVKFQVKLHKDRKTRIYKTLRRFGEIKSI